MGVRAYVHERHLSEFYSSTPNATLNPQSRPQPHLRTRNQPPIALQAKFDDIKIKAEECHNNATEAQAAGGVAPKKQSSGSRQRKGGYEAVGNGEGQN